MKIPPKIPLSLLFFTASSSAKQAKKKKTLCRTFYTRPALYQLSYASLGGEAYAYIRI